MSHDEDDYFSDKFLADVTPSHSGSKTYVQRRKEAERLSRLKNEQNRKKSRRQLEKESQAAGLSRSLFERDTDGGVQGSGSSSNKALSMMMKMGFQPGQPLGKRPEDDVSAVDSGASESNLAEGQNRHKIEPLSITEWEGKKGIGLLKRPQSSVTTERFAKIAKMTETSTREEFRDRAKQEYEGRRAETRLGPAQRTCRTLDERGGKTFNVLWLDPNNVETFPVGLLETVMLHSTVPLSLPAQTQQPMQDQLRRQMQQDKLQPLSAEDLTGLSSPEKEQIPAGDQYSPELIDEIAQFLRLGVNHFLTER
ncbi:hypothetical protein AX17_000897 [Amanita inopinata Kibby_2008]|nr:hypothetical protein AX17_000897 [Amanita inopinata Kibby_2008]